MSDIPEPIAIIRIKHTPPDPAQHDVAFVKALIEGQEPPLHLIFETGSKLHIYQRDDRATHIPEDKRDGRYYVWPEEVLF